jgi:cytochrome c biogenesis protein CcmG/thiol:disulfide interchange protein DsbE
MTDSTASKPSRWSRRVIGPFTLRHLVILGSVLGATTVLLGLLTTPIVTPSQQALPAPNSGIFLTGERTTGLARGQIAPELSGEVEGVSVPLLDLDGQTVTLADRRGEPVWITFFATWCPPCQEETPILREAHARFASEGLQMVSISVQETTATDVEAYADTYSLPYTIGFDATSAVYRAYQGFGLPTHYFLDGEGVIRNVVFGPVDRAQVADIVEPLLAEAEADSAD